MRFSRSMLELHLCILFMGATGLFSKSIALDAIAITSLRTFFAAIALLIVLGWMRKLPFLSLKALMVQGSAAVLLGAHWITYFHAMQKSTVAIGMLALYTYPVLTVLLEPLFFRTRIRPKDVFSAILVFVGVAILLPDFDWQSDVVQGVASGLLSALLFALRNLLLARFGRNVQPLQSMWVQVSVIALLMLPVSIQVSGLSSKDWILLVALGLGFTAGTHSLFVHALQHLRTTTVSLISCLQPLYGTLYAAVMLSEQPSWSVLIGGALIIFAAVSETLSASRSASEAKE